MPLVLAADKINYGGIHKFHKDDYVAHTRSLLTYINTLYSTGSCCLQ